VALLLAALHGSTGGHACWGPAVCQDADSLDVERGKKTEGAFYLWSEAEVDEVLGPELASVFKPHYYVKPGGNADLSRRSDPHGEFHGKNTLIARQSIVQTASASGAPPPPTPRPRGQ
jgi:uncharacterized protein YyaL (SSP411 family)